MDPVKKEHIKQWLKKAGKIFLILACIAVIICIILWLSIYFPYRARHPKTGDAYVQAHVVYVAPQISGQVTKVYVKNLQDVKKDQALFKINPKPFKLAEAKAASRLKLAQQKVHADHVGVITAEKKLTAKKAHLADTQAKTARLLELAQRGTISKQAAEAARTKLTAAKADMAAAESALNEAKVTAGRQGADNAREKEAQALLNEARLNVQHTLVTAPEAGTLAKLRLRPGNWVTQGSSPFALIEENSWWVAANFKENDLARIKPGMPCSISIALYPDHNFKGIVARISQGSGASFSLLPSENASGNWVKVTRRFPVVIQFIDRDKKYRLRVGASTSIVINTTVKPESLPHANTH